MKRRESERPNEAAGGSRRARHPSSPRGSTETRAKPAAPRERTNEGATPPRRDAAAARPVATAKRRATPRARTGGQRTNAAPGAASRTAAETKTRADAPASVLADHRADARARKRTDADERMLSRAARARSSRVRTARPDLPRASSPRGTHTDPAPAPIGRLRPLPDESPFRRRTRRRSWWNPPAPWTVYRYVFIEILRVFILANLAVGLVYTSLVAFQTVRSGLQISLIWPLIAKASAYPLYYSIPIAFLFATTLVIGRMASDLEITALRTHGISHAQIFAPVLVFAVLLSGVSWYLNGWVVPEIHYEKRNVHKYVLEQLRSLGSGENRRFVLPNNKGTLWVGAFRGTELRKVHIALNTRNRATIVPALREHLPQGLPSEVSVFAKEGHLEVLPDQGSVYLHLREVTVQVPETVAGANRVARVFHQGFRISDTVIIPLRFTHKRPSLKDRTHPELDEYIAELRAASAEELAAAAVGRPPPRERVEGGGEDDDSAAPRYPLTEKLYSAKTERHRRLAFTISCLTFPLVGVSLALLLYGRGRLVPLLVSNLVVIAVFYPLLVTGVYLGENGWFPAASLAVPNLAVLALGIYLARNVVKQ